MVYAFEPLTPGSRLRRATSQRLCKKVWQFDFDPAGPKTNVHEYISNRQESPSNIYGMPVFHRRPALRRRRWRHLVGQKPGLVEVHRLHRHGRHHHQRRWFGPTRSNST